jgi:hypothetical protein
MVLIYNLNLLIVSTVHAPSESGARRREVLHITGMEEKIK